MSEFRLIISTPKGVYLDEQVEELYLNTSNGYIGIFKGMDSLITGVNIDVGFIKIKHIKKIYAIFEGVVIVNNNEVNLVVSNIEESEKINLDRAIKSKERAESRLKKLDKELDTTRAKQSLIRANARIKAAKKEVL